MFIRTKIVKGNQYFYLAEGKRVQGKTHPVQKTIAYLGNRNQAIATLEAMDILDKEKLLSRVQAATTATGPNKGKRGRPRKLAE